MNTNPIGIFDSGIGGLTVAKAIKYTLPHEQLIYFGDTAHLPYGDKSTAAIQAYAVKICNLLLEKNCKLIVIACNSASAAAYELVKEYVASKAKVINVIDPAVDYITQNFKNKQVGLIGTKQTVNSNIYLEKIEKNKVGIALHALATPLLAPMIEEGFYDESVSKSILNQYLSNPILSKINALILGCTHYPLIKAQVIEYYNNEIDIIDSSEHVAEAVKKYLINNNLLTKKRENVDKFFVSDYTRSFEASTKIFFGEEVHIEHYPLWQ